MNKQGEINKAKLRSTLQLLRRVKCDNFRVIGPAKRKLRLLFPKPTKRKGRGCRVSDRDDDAKVRLGYTNRWSFVRLDGSEHLEGEDWQKRKREIWERGNGWCEYTWCPAGPSDAPMNRCWKAMDDPHHKVKRSRKRDDRASNLIGLCRMHHDLLDSRRVRWGRQEAKG